MLCGGRRTRLGDGLLERRLGHRLGPRLAALDGQLARGLDGRLVRRDASAEVVELGQPRTLLDVAEDLLELLAVQGLLLQELTGEDVEDVAVLGEDRPRLGVRGLDELADLVVDVAGDLMAVVGLGAHRAAQERVAVLGAVAHRTQFGAHAVFGHHRAGDLGGLLDIGDRTGGRLTEHQFLGRAATHGEHQPGDHLRAGHQPLVVLGHRDGVAAGAAAGQDRDLVDRLDIGHRPRRQGVSTLVVGGDLLLQLADHLALAARSADHPVDGLLQRRTGDDGAVLPGGQQGGLIDDVGKVGTGHPHGPLGQTVEVGVGGQRLALGVHP